MPAPACCICAVYICSEAVVISEKTEKPLSVHEEYPCCSRLICRPCLEQRPQFSNYCPYCQHTGSTTEKSASSYSSSAVYTAPTQSALLGLSKPPQTPPRPSRSRPRDFSEKETEPAPDVLHFVDPNNDSINVLSIRYGVPVTVLRQMNGIYSDHLLAGRRTILISGEYYKGGVSLSPRPIDGEEEENRKSKIRKWMMACKVVDYEVAEFYLSQADYDLDVAVMTYKDDEKWEQENPLHRKGKAKGISRLTGGAMSSPIRW